MRIKLMALLASGFMLSQAAFAQIAPAAKQTAGNAATKAKADARDSYLKELARVNSENMLLKAKLQKLETQAKLAAKRAEIEKYFQTNSTYGVPVVMAVEGVGKSLYATLAFENGSEMNARAGMRLPNGMNLLWVQPGSVVAASGKHKINLAFGSSTGSQSQNMQQQQPGMPMPGMPGMMKPLAALPPLPIFGIK